jgi:AI-2 transport protein TqsA
MEKRNVSMSSSGRSGVVNALLATVLLSAAFYFARVVLEPIAFAFFGIALVWPLLKALEARMPNAIALLLTVLVTLVGFLMLHWRCCSLDFGKSCALSIPVRAGNAVA